MPSRKDRVLTGFNLTRIFRTTETSLKIFDLSEVRAVGEMSLLKPNSPFSPPEFGDPAGQSQFLRPQESDMWMFGVLALQIAAGKDSSYRLSPTVLRENFCI